MTIDRSNHPTERPLRRAASLLLLTAGLALPACGLAPGRPVEADVQVVVPADSAGDATPGASETPLVESTPDPSNAPAPSPTASAESAEAGSITPIVDDEATTDTPGSDTALAAKLDAPIGSAEEALAYYRNYAQHQSRHLADALAGEDDFDDYVTENDFRDPSLFANSAVADAYDDYACFQDDIDAVQNGVDLQWVLDLGGVDEIRPGLWVVTSSFTVSSSQLAEDTTELYRSVVTSNGVFGDVPDFDAQGRVIVEDDDGCDSELTAKGEALRDELIAYYGG